MDRDRDTRLRRRRGGLGGIKSEVSFFVFFSLNLKGRLKKNGKKNDIVQKGGEGLSLNHSFEFVLKE